MDTPKFDEIQNRLKLIDQHDQNHADIDEMAW